MIPRPPESDSREFAGKGFIISNILNRINAMTAYVKLKGIKRIPIQ